MHTYAFQALSLVILPVMIGLWIGTMGLGKAKRDGAWWCMISGITLQSIIMLVHLAITFGMMLSPDLFDPVNGFAFGIGTWAVSSLGSLLFAIGFALMGWKAARRSDRITELELMNLAQATELERLRNR